MPESFIIVKDSLPEVVGKTGITVPNPTPYEDISLLIVAYNESERIGSLIELLKPFFTHTVICVQESTDDTLEIAQALANREHDQVLTDQHWGHGDHSFPMMVEASDTEWCFVVSCDERPSIELLQTLQSAIAWGDQFPGITDEAVWVPFVSTIEGFEVPENVGHLRLFKRSVGWPRTLHSRPMTERSIWWPHGHILHARSLDEMVKDYLSYFEVGRGVPGWERHNKTMMHDACVFVAERAGWPYVTKYEWWDQVAKLAFTPEEIRQTRA